LFRNVTRAVACFAHDKSAAETFFAFVVNFARAVADIAVYHALSGLELPFTFTFNTVCWHRTAAIAFRTIYFTVTFASVADQ